METWRKMIDEKLKSNKETWDSVESNTLTEEEMDIKFETGYGGSEGVPFTVWTKDHVYFPGVYDGAEWVDFVSRNPDGKPTPHIGGE